MFYGKILALPICFNSTEIRLIGKDELKPGRTAIAFIKLLPARTLRKNLKVKDAFTLTEGNKTVGSGVIEKVEVE